MTTHSFPTGADHEDERRTHHVVMTAGTLAALGLIVAVLLNRPAGVTDRSASPDERSTQTTAVWPPVIAAAPSHDFVVVSEEEAGLLRQRLESITDASGTLASATWRGTIHIAPPTVAPPPYVVYLVATAEQQRAMADLGLADGEVALVAGSDAERCVADAQITLLEMRSQLASPARDVRVVDLRSQLATCGSSSARIAAP